MVTLAPPAVPRVVTDVRYANVMVGVGGIVHSHIPPVMWQRGGGAAAGGGHGNCGAGCGALVRMAICPIQDEGP